MASRLKIGKAAVAALQPGEVVWDTSLIGFGARRQRSAVVSYILQCRLKDGTQRKITIGRHGQPWTPDTARDEAKKQLGKIVGGEDPTAIKKAEKAALTVAALCDAYLDDARAGRLLTRRRTVKKASTIATDEGRVERHIKPLLGKLKVAAVTRDDVEAFLHDVAAGKTAMREKTAKRGGLAEVRGGRGTATRTVGLLGAIFAYAIRRGHRPDSPVVGVARFADQRRERRLSDGEYPQLGSALEAAGEKIWPPAISAARFLLLTGWRRGEVVGLRWEEVDLQRRTAFLADTKTGRSIRPLAAAACEIIQAQSHSGAYVFAAARGEGAMNGFPKFWKRILQGGGLPADITPHVLRHSFASLASDLGFSEPTIAALIGHARHTTTSRYVHSADAVLLAAADQISREIQERLT